MGLAVVAAAGVGVRVTRGVGVGSEEGGVGVTGTGGKVGGVGSGIGGRGV